jgi:hypothetical protein
MSRQTGNSARLPSARRLTSVAAAVGAVVAVLASGASSAPQAVDLELQIGAANFQPTAPITVPNGGRVSVTRLNFFVEAAAVVRPVAASEDLRATIQVELGAGLRWGADDPDPAEGCTSTPTTGRCELPMARGEREQGWFWEVVAAQPGSYAFRGEIVAATVPDPDSTNNASAITIVVTEGSGSAGGGGSGGGGGSTAVSTTAARVTPAKPKAGGAVTASVRVRAGGAPVRPTRVACAGSIGSAKVRAAARAASGTASCTFRPPAAAKGKVLRGSIAFTAQGQRFTKRFSARLG